MDPQSLMKKALMELKDMRGRLESIEYRQREPIAIIGLGCRLPGGINNADAYWRALESGTDAITEVPADRWDINDYYSADPDAPGKMYCRYGGFLDSFDTFDAHLFGISQKETVNIDPQHRILLEVTWEALENASIATDVTYGSNTGVFVGISGFEHGALQFVAGDARTMNAYSGVGSGLCAASGRMSYTFGFTGPCMSVDTACSSSLVAVHLACQSLRRRECDMAIAGGVNLILIPAPNIIFSRARMLSPDGRCKTFDAGADGYVRGEGCGVVVLKRLSDAVADGDNVLALIRGSAVNQDGPSGGFTVPSGPAQGRVIRSALLDGAVDPAEVSYIEAHGTGTTLGDPIEVGALGAVFKAVKSKADPLVIGTVKTNLGHLEAAAGVAGLIKVVLSMQHGTIPPHLHFKTPNPHIDWLNLPIEVASGGRPWHGKKIAGVSSFGFSGTNAHVVLEEAPVHKRVATEITRPCHILTISAKTDESLSGLIMRYRDMLSSSSGIMVSDICHTSNVGRSHFARRSFVAGETAAELLKGLSEPTAIQLPEGRPKLAFLFTGQGRLYPGMGRGLYESSPVFRDTLTECDKILRGHMDVPLLELMYGDIPAEVLDETRYAQPVLFSLEYALYELWKSWGIEAGALLGHSIGEDVAACVSGVFSLEESMMLVTGRGRLMGETPGDGADGAIVRFSKGMETLYKDGYRMFLELGPGAALLGMGSRCVNAKTATAWFPSLREGHDDWRQILKSLGGLYMRGMDVNWSGFNAPYGYKKVQLPTYPFARRRYQIDVKFNTPETQIAPGNSNSLLGVRLSLSTGDIVFENRLTYESPDFIKQHRIYEYAVVPGTVYIEMALAAGKYLTRSETITLSNFKIFHPLTISENERGTKIQTLIMPENDNSGFTFKIFSRLETIDDGLPWLLHAGGTISAVSTTTAENPEALASVKSRCAQELEVSDIYRQFASRGLQYGPDFRAIQKLWTGDGEALGLIILSASVDSSTYNTHPIAIDAALQTAFALISHTTTENFLPVGIGTLTARLQPVTKLWSHARTISTTDNEMKLDFTVYRDDGTPVMFMEGLTAKKADRTKLIRKSEARLDDFLYEIYWERRDSEAAHQTADLPVQSGQWVVFSDRDALGMELASHFRENGLECVIVGPGAAYRELPGGEGCEVNPQSAGDFEKLFSAFGRLSGVVYLWGAAVTNPDGGLSYIKEQQDIGVIGLLHTVQVLVKHGRATRLMAATRGVWPVGQDRVNNVRPWQAPVWGFGRVLFIEHPELDSILVDLAAIPGQSEGLFLYNELFHGGRQRQTALRDGKRYCCRLKRRGLSAAPVPEAENTALRLSEYGTMDALSLKPADRVSPSGNEVEIEVKAAGLNFRDVLNALGMLREFSRGKTAQEVAFGFECSGVVSRIGSEVKDIRPGDPVIAAPVSGTFSAYTTVDSDFVSPMPENMSYNESATLPLAYLTAWYGVIVLCRLRAGDSVLIHAAAGGVGLAALNLAKMVNATIYATASRGKWDFLRAQGVKHIMDSRSLDFSDEVMALTGGRGVDMVLNSLNGEYIPKGLSVLKEGGSFIEIGKIGIWTEEEARRFRPDISYHSFDLGEVSPSVISAMLRDITSHVNAGALPPLIHKVFPITDAVAAFRYMAASKHVGKVVLDMGNIRNEQIKRGIICSDATYVVTGGLGALGLELCSWLVEMGARHIALAGRREAGLEAREKISRLQGQGVSVMAVSADASVLEDVERLFSAIGGAMPPVRGVFHAAGVLEDSVILNQDAERFRRVMGPKVCGTWNLYNIIKNTDIDFLVLFSSASSVLGSAGQANYAGANAFLDSAAYYISGCGIRTIAIEWGPWAGAGMAAGRPESTLKTEKSGFNKIEIKDGLAILEKLLYDTHANTCVVDVNWHTYLTRLPYEADAGFLESLYSEISGAASRDSLAAVQEQSLHESEILKKIRGASSEEVPSIIVSYIKAAVYKVLGSDESTQVSMEEPLMEQGFDSLMSVEFSNLVSKDLDISLPVGFLFSYPTIRAISNYLKNEFFGKDNSVKSDEKVAASLKDPNNLDYIDALSDGELEELIRKDLL